MDQLLELLPLLTGAQIDALTQVALAMRYNEPKKADAWLSVSQIRKEFGVPTSTVYSAMSTGRLAYSTPKGQTKPRYASREDVEAWLGRHSPSAR